MVASLASWAGPVGSVLLLLVRVSGCTLVGATDPHSGDLTTFSGAAHHCAASLLLLHSLKCSVLTIVKGSALPNLMSVGHILLLLWPNTIITELMMVLELMHKVLLICCLHCP